LVRLFLPLFLIKIIAPATSYVKNGSQPSYAELAALPSPGDPADGPKPLTQGNDSVSPERENRVAMLVRVPEQHDVAMGVVPS
jgi:hypothetical protein